MMITSLRSLFSQASSLRLNSFKRFRSRPLYLSLIMSLEGGGGEGGGGGGGGEGGGGGLEGLEWLDGLDELFWDEEPWLLFDSNDAGGGQPETAVEPPVKPPEASSNDPPGPAPNSLTVCGKRPLEEGSTKSSNSKEGEQEEKGGGESEHELHLRTERERRKKMRSMFSNLHALLPRLPEKTDKTSIVNEAILYVRKLEEDVRQLEKLKEERIRGMASGESSAQGMKMKGVETTTKEALKAGEVKNLAVANTSTAVAIPEYPSSFRTWASPNVVLNVTGADAHISICTAKKPGIVTAIAQVLDKYKIEVVLAQISSNNFRSMIIIHAHASGVTGQCPQNLMNIEDMYKYAVGDILTLLSS